MFKKIAVLFCCLILSGCYETEVEVISANEAVRIDLVKDLVFEGYGLEQGGTFAATPDMYRIIGREPPNDFIYDDDKPVTGPRRMRVKPLEPDLFLMQVTPLDQANPRHQLILLRRNGQFFEILMPQRFNDEGIDVVASQQAFVDELGLRIEKLRGYGMKRLYGDERRIERFMHSLITLPTEVVYRFKAEGAN